MSTQKVYSTEKKGKRSLPKGYKKTRRVKQKPTFDFNYPATIVIAINTHGFILINEDGMYDTFKVRKGITFYKINAVVPGVCNILWDEQNQDNINIVEQAIYKVKSKYNEEDNGNNQPMSMYDFSNEIRNILFGYQSFFQKDLKREMDEIKSRGEDEKIHKEYLQHFDKGFALCDFTDSVMINKGFTRSNEEGIGLHHDWQITVVNMKEKPDVVKNINLEKGIGIHHHGTSETTLKEIIDHLYSHGVKRILMVDFSCSNFVDENFNDVLTDRGVRSMRSTILENEASHCTPPTIKPPSK